MPITTLAREGQKNRSVWVSRESQHEIALVQALSRLIPDYARRSGKNQSKMWLRFASLGF